MGIQNKLSKTFNAFFESERSGAILLVLCTFGSLLLSNSSLGESYLQIWHAHIGGLNLEAWINDGLMTIFFLLIGLELERELYSGELADFKTALLPIFAAIGGIIAPALIHLSFNHGLNTRAGIGIPMATDIAFALGMLALLGNRVPASLKIFLAALAVIDDLAAIIVIAVFYTATISLLYLAGALVIFTALMVLNRVYRVASLFPYLVGGVLIWALMLNSGVHATVAGVLLAFCIPFTNKEEDERSPSHRLEHFLQKPVAFLILPIFALANTGIVVGADWSQNLTSANSWGIMLGLLAGKPIGITLMALACIGLRICKMPADLNRKHILGAGLLGGIGFTMSIFITNLAFTGDAVIINASKMAILLASIAAGIIGFLWLRVMGGADSSNS